MYRPVNVTLVLDQ